MAVIELLSWKEIVSQSSLIKKFLSYCIVKDNDAQLQQIVIGMRLNYSLKIPDAFIAATAMRYNLLLVFGDPVFKRIKELDFLLLNSEHPIILFDGICNFCNSAINFVLKQDKKGLFKFAPLQSEAGQELLQQYHLSTEDFDSFVLIDEGKVYKKSAASLRVMNKLPWYWKEAQILRIIPPAFRDAIYDFVARNRYKWFGKKEQCMIPTPEMRSRFLV